MQRKRQQTITYYVSMAELEAILMEFVCNKEGKQIKSTEAYIRPRIEQETDGGPYDKPIGNPQLVGIDIVIGEED